MKNIYIAIVFIFCFQIINAQILSQKTKQIVDLNIDSNYVKPLIFDSIAFLTIRIEAINYQNIGSLTKDSIIELQNRLISQVKFVKIDTLIMEVFLEDVDVMRILNQLTDVQVLVVSSLKELRFCYEASALLSKTKKLNSLYLTGEKVVVDLATIDFFRVKKLGVQIQDITYRSAHFKNKSTQLEYLEINASVNSAFFFKLKNRRKFPRSCSFLVGGTSTVPFDKSLHPDSSSPHKGKV